MLTVAPEFSLLARLLAVLAAVLPIRTVWRHHALARRMRALCRFSHDPPLVKGTLRPPGSDHKLGDAEGSLSPLCGCRVEFCNPSWDRITDYARAKRAKRLGQPGKGSAGPGSPTRVFGALGWKISRGEPLTGWNVADDEQLLAWANEAELATREVFDGGRVFAKTTGRFAKGFVLFAELVDLSRELLRLPSGAPHARQPPVPDETGHRDGRAHPHQPDPHEPLHALS